MENNYQLSRIHNYVNGLMSKDDMYALEREALDDPFLQDAIDGYRLQEGIDVKQLSLLQQRLANRIEEQVSGKNKRFYNWQRLAIGMAAGVLFVAVCTLLLIRHFPHTRQSNLTEVTILQDNSIFEYEITPLRENTAYPEGNWDALKELLLSNYTNADSIEGKVKITLTVDDRGRASDMVMEYEGKKIQDTELVDLIRNNISWKGDKAQFYLQIDKLDL